MLSTYSTADEIQDSGVDLALLPIGSTEQHGSHLPLATDYIIAAALGEKVAEKLGAFLLPAMPISTCREHMGKKGSIWINPDTFFHMMRDIVMSLKEQGFKRVVILQAHGGIFMLTPIVRELNAVNADIKVIRVDLSQFSQTKEMEEILECRNNLHACESETSLMLYLNEEFVRKDRIMDWLPNVPRDYLNYASIFKYSSIGVWGMPSLATAEKGEKILNILTEKCVEYVNNVEKLFDK